MLETPLFTTGHNLVRNILQKQILDVVICSITFTKIFKLYVPTIQELVLSLNLLKNETGVISYFRKDFQKNQDILV